MPIGLIRDAGAKGVSLDAALLRPQDEDAIGEAIEAGTAFFLGVVPGTDTRLPDIGVVAKPALELWRRLGFPPSTLADQVVLTPTCGLAGATPPYAKAALAKCREGRQGPPRRPGRGVTRARPPGVRRGAAPGPAGAASRVLTRELSATAVTLSVRLVDGCSPDGAAVPRGETGDERRAGRACRRRRGSGTPSSPSW